MKKLAMLCVILVVGLLVVTGCSESATNDAPSEPPALPEDTGSDDTGEDSIQPPPLPEE